MCEVVAESERRLHIIAFLWVRLTFAAAVAGVFVLFVLEGTSSSCSISHQQLSQPSRCDDVVVVGDVGVVAASEHLCRMVAFLWVHQPFRRDVVLEGTLLCLFHQATYSISHPCLSVSQPLQ